MALPSVGGGYQFNDGNLNELTIGVQPAPQTATSTATLTVTQLLGGLLVVEDKLSMAYSLESRVPFLDNDLVDFALTCPTHYKLSDPLHLPPTDHNAVASARVSAYDAHADGKRLLRRVMGRYQPRGIEAYQKQGFSGPDSSWFKGPSMELVRNRLLDPNAPVYSILDYRAVSALVVEHLAGKSNHRLLIWSLLTTNEALI